MKSEQPTSAKVMTNVNNSPAPPSSLLLPSVTTPVPSTTWSSSVKSVFESYSNRIRISNHDNVITFLSPAASAVIAATTSGASILRESTRESNGFRVCDDLFFQSCFPEYDTTYFPEREFPEYSFPECEFLEYTKQAVTNTTSSAAAIESVVSASLLVLLLRQGWGSYY